MNYLTKSNIYYILCLGIIILLSVFILKPDLVTQGDSPSYIEAIHVLNTGIAPQGFVPNRILTTFLGLETVRVLSSVFGSITFSWLFMNIVFYFIICVLFYRIILILTKSDKTAFISGLFLASNYSLVSFGINYLMDAGGWAFYIISTYLLLKYVESSERRYLWYSALAVGVGGLFKEYAFLGFIPTIVFLFYDNYSYFFKFLRKTFILGLVTIIPTILLYFYVYARFGYTYLDWLGFNKEYYVYSSRILEYVKSLGSLFNMLAILVLGGLYTLFFNRSNMIEDKYKVYIISIASSIAPIFFWPAITQRILFVTVPFGVLLASFFIKKYEKHWYILIPILCVYIICSFFMTSILDIVNLPF